MATILDLNTSIISMSDEESFELIKSIRFDRRIVKKTTMRRTSSKKKPARTVDLKSSLGLLSNEARLKLIAELSGD
jgi:hypothetical protein